MAVNNYLLQRVQQRDCLFALLACNGGTVPSLLDSAKQIYPQFNSASGSTWAERNGLMTLQNIVVQDNLFTAADPQKLAAVKTQLNLQNNDTSKTFFIRMIFYKTTDGNTHISSLFNQGSYILSQAYYVFNITYRENGTESYFNISYSLNDDTKVQHNYIVNDSFFGKWHTIAVVYNCTVPTAAYSQIFLDGQIISRKSFSHKPWHTPDSPYDIRRLCIREDVIAQYITGNQFEWAAIFDSAWSPEEITLVK